MNKSSSGFTIVELLIVIVVIAILAAISVVAYNGVQVRANDAKMGTAANQVEKALELWSIDYGSDIKGGLGSTVASGGAPCTDGSLGFFGKGAYTCSAEESLVAAKLLPSGFSGSLPSNSYYATSGGGKYSMMLYTCTPAGAGKWVLFWTLQNPSATDSVSINSALTTCGSNVAIRDTWGMRAGKVIQL